MAQEFKIQNYQTDEEFTFNSATDAKTIGLSDDAFAQIMALDRLTEAVDKLSSRL